MRTKKHFVVPLTTIKVIKNRVIGKVFLYNKVETKLVDIGENEQELQQKSITEESLQLAIEEAAKNLREKEIPDKVEDTDEKTAIFNSNKRKLDAEIALAAPIFDDSKRPKLMSATSNLSTDQNILIKNLDSSSSATPTMMIPQQQQQLSQQLNQQKVPEKSSTSVNTPSDVTQQELNTPSLLNRASSPSIHDNDLSVLTEPSPEQITELSNPPADKDPETKPDSEVVEKYDRYLPPFEGTHPVQQKLSDTGSIHPEYPAASVPTHYRSDEENFGMHLYYPRFPDEDSYVLMNLDIHKDKPKVTNDIILQQEQQVTIIQKAQENLQEKTLTNPSVSLKQHSILDNESDALNFTNQNNSHITSPIDLTKNTDSLPSTSSQQKSIIRVEASKTVKLNQLKTNSNFGLNSVETYETQAGLPEITEFVAMMPRGQITARDVWMQQQIYMSFKRAYEQQQRASQIIDKGFKVPETYTTAGDDKVEIYAGCKFYLPQMKKTLIDLKYEEEKSWDVIVKEVLLEVYGENIIHFSATGKGTHARPKIHPDLLTGLLGWINHGKEGEELIDKKKLIAEINHISSNKRGYLKRKNAEN